jgi:hypothetical protein
MGAIEGGPGEKRLLLCLARLEKADRLLRSERFHRRLRGQLRDPTAHVCSVQWPTDLCIIVCLPLFHEPILLNPVPIVNGVVLLSLQVSR